MAMQKTGDSESFEVLRGLEAQALNEHLAKTGKSAISDLDADEREALDKSLKDARKQEEELNNESGSERD